jgi:hypothetical protein
MFCASCPAREGRSIRLSPRASADLMIARRTPACIGTGSMSGCWCHAAVTPCAAAVAMAAAASRSRRVASRSRSGSRKSSVSDTRPGITFAAPGQTCRVPQVTTASALTAAARSGSAETNAAAPTRASRRPAIGVVPAWPGSPANSTRAPQSPVMAVTTAMSVRSCSSRGPCSTCSSTKAWIRPGASAVSVASPEAHRQLDRASTRRSPFTPVIESSSARR